MFNVNLYYSIQIIVMNTNLNHSKAYKWTIVFMLFVLLYGCQDKSTSVTMEQREEIDNRIKKIRVEDSLVSLLDSIQSVRTLLKEKTDPVLDLTHLVVLRRLGKIRRDESRFDEALNTYNKCLNLAEVLRDTIEGIQALNNIGTCYRRLGLLDIAIDYHYRAWKMSEHKVKSDTSYMSKKSRVVSLNGLGNIYLTQGNYERADSALRMALAGEKELKSHLGQAINYSNLGAIYQHWEQHDSAWAYYRRSMQENRLAKSKLGIALCHVNFGSLYEQEGNYDKAISELQQAYEQMLHMKDEWHALSPLLSLINLAFVMKEYEQAEVYLNRALETAGKIQSNEHLAAIYMFYYRLHAVRGNYKDALESHVKAVEYQNSVVDMKKLNKTQNTSLSIERYRQEREVNTARQLYKKEKELRTFSYLVFGIFLILCIIVFYLMYYSSKVKAKSHRILMKQSEMREVFFTNVTHEFRTPLTLILGLSHSIHENEGLSESVREMGSTIERQGKNLLRLINQLLYISKVKSELGEPDWCHGNIAAYIRMIVEGFANYAAQKKIILNFVGDDIYMDFVPDYMNKVINNLLFNAFKFTPAYGTVDIRLCAYKENVSLSVADTGEGIAADDIPHLFEPFIQGKNRKSGTGVGLALVHQIVESVHGSVKVKSKLGEGTTFLITFPIRQKNTVRPSRELNYETEVTGQKKSLEDELAEHLEAENFAEKSQMLVDNNNLIQDTRNRILIVEDNHDVANYIGSQLSDNYALYYASDGKEGLHKAHDLMPDLIITDLMMPEMDGLEMCRRVRTDELISHVPVIVITARVTDADRIKGLEAGADAYLNKPFNEEELHVRVVKLLEQRRLLREKYSEAIIEDKEKEVEETLTPTDVQFLNKVVDCVYLLMSQKDASVNSIASRLCMSTRQFQRKITAVTGETPSVYIMQLRIKRAKQLMDSVSDLTVAEIAEECGFEDASNFSRAFKKYCEITPTQYMHRNEK